MQPGFQAEVESRRRAEQELSSTADEREELARRLQQAQLELQHSTAPSGVESA
jgi:hypothetical protein